MLELQKKIFNKRVIYIDTEVNKGDVNVIIIIIIIIIINLGS